MKIMVTGGGGFLGKGITLKLLEMGHKIKTFSRGDYPHLKEKGVEVLKGDIRNQQQILSALEGCTAVFHTASKTGVSNDYKEYYNTNVKGTENIIKACLHHKINKLIYTSSPSVVFDGKDQKGVDESCPYPKKFLAHYPKTKAMAEQMVIQANSPQLATICLRPHLIWGPGDNHLIPRILHRAKSGRLRLVGNGTNLVDTVYIDNAVSAHIRAFEKLSPGSPVSGKVYFITNDEPIEVKKIIDMILDAGGFPPINKKIPVSIAYLMGGLLELIYSLLNKKEEPLMTRFVALELSQSHWFDISSAKRDLNYIPSISIEEGMKKLKAHLSRE